MDCSMDFGVQVGDFSLFLFFCCWRSCLGAG